MSLSIVIPTFNELTLGYLEKILSEVSSIREAEVIVVDGGSTDGTKELIRKFPVKSFELKNSNRGNRLDLGIKKAKYDLILLHHPRSFLSKESILFLNKAQARMDNYWGGFTHQFDEDSLFYSFTSWYSNRVRAKRGILYLDHCIFLTKTLFDKITFPVVDIFEDTLLSLRLKKYSRPVILPLKSTTSAVRFKKNGAFKQAVLNQKMKLLFLFRSNLSIANKEYENKLNLNSLVDD